MGQVRRLLPREQYLLAHGLRTAFRRGWDFRHNPVPVRHLAKHLAAVQELCGLLPGPLLAIAKISVLRFAVAAELAVEHFARHHEYPQYNNSTSCLCALESLFRQDT